MVLEPSVVLFRILQQDVNDWICTSVVGEKVWQSYFHVIIENVSRFV